MQGLPSYVASNARGGITRTVSIDSRDCTSLHCHGEGENPVDAFHDLNLVPGDQTTCEHGPIRTSISRNMDS